MIVGRCVGRNISLQGFVRRFYHCYWRQNLCHRLVGLARHELGEGEWFVKPCVILGDGINASTTVLEVSLSMVAVCGCGGGNVSLVIVA